MSQFAFVVQTTCLIAALMMGSSVRAEVARDRCDSTSIGDGVSILYKDAPVKQVKQILRPSSTFSDHAEVVCVQSGNMNFRRKVEAYQIEFGVKDGFGYRIDYSDSSGSIGQLGKEKDDLAASLWGVDCSIDSMDDSKSCYMNQGSLFIWYYGPGEWRVHIGARNYPDSDIALRVGNSKAIHGKEPAFTASDSQRIIQQLIVNQDSTVGLRFQEWPSGTGEEEISLQGFGVALELIEWAYSNVEP